MTTNAFLEITPKEFYLALKDKNEQDGLKVETNVKMICNAIRKSTRHLLNLSGKSLKRPITNDHQIMVFPWDKNTVQKPQTKKEMMDVMRGIAEHYKKRKAKTKKNASKRRTS